MKQAQQNISIYVMDQQMLTGKVYFIVHVSMAIATIIMVFSHQKATNN